MWSCASSSDRWPYGRFVEAFGLETGSAQLEAVFDEVTTDLYEDSLAVTEAEPLVAYVESSLVFSGEVEALRKAVEAHMAQNGTFHISKYTGVFHGRRRP